MKILVISDTHDDKPFFEMLPGLIKRLGLGTGVTAIHCGDHIAPFTVEWMEGAGITMLYGVLGNNDGETRLLRRRYEERGWSLEDLVNIVELHGRRIAITHGTFMELPDILAETGRYDIVLYGHTHRVDHRWVGDTLVLNPGEACGYLTGRRTVAVLDLEKMEAEVVEVGPTS